MAFWNCNVASMRTTPGATPAVSAECRKRRAVEHATRRRRVR
jgi:hypothetical protein